MGPPVRFAFDRCDSSLIVRSVVAAVDHLSASAGIDVDLLDSLEVPVGECLAGLHEHDISEVSVSVRSERLELSIVLDRALAHHDLDLGEADEIVRSYFDISVVQEERRVVLTGVLA